MSLDKSKKCILTTPPYIFVLIYQYKLLVTIKTEAKIRQKAPSTKIFLSQECYPSVSYKASIISCAYPNVVLFNPVNLTQPINNQKPLLNRIKK